MQQGLPKDRFAVDHIVMNTLDPEILQPVALLGKPEVEIFERRNRVGICVRYRPSVVGNHVSSGLFHPAS